MDNELKNVIVNQATRIYELESELKISKDMEKYWRTQYMVLKEGGRPDEYIPENIGDYAGSSVPKQG